MQKSLRQKEKAPDLESGAGWFKTVPGHNTPRALVWVKTQRWDASDDEMVSLKIGPANRRMHEETERAERLFSSEYRKLGQGFSSTFFSGIGDSALDVFRKYLEENVDPVYREVWVKRGRTVDAQFVRGVLRQKICDSIGSRHGGFIQPHIQTLAHRTTPTASQSTALDHIALAVEHLVGEFTTRYEVEARELEWEAEQKAASETQEALTRLTVPTQDSDTERKAQSASADLPSKTALMIQRGERCDRIIAETRRVKYFCLDAARTMTEARAELHGLEVWKLRENLAADDRDVFDHPRQWGPVVGYALRLLAKDYGHSVHTIVAWRKAFRASNAELERGTKK